jgi:hypothetical protein
MYVLFGALGIDNACSVSPGWLTFVNGCASCAFTARRRAAVAGSGVPIRRSIAGFLEEAGAGPRQSRQCNLGEHASRFYKLQLLSLIT